MAEILLTWNPTKYEISAEEYRAAVELTAGGGEETAYWSCGGRTGGIGPADYVFLLRQAKDRGIVAAGYVTGEVFQEPHWDGSNRLANYVPVMWTVWLPTEDRLRTEELKAGVAAVSWDRLQGSGVRLEPGAATEVDSLWADHLDAIGWARLSSPDEVPPSAGYHEGAVSRVGVNRYERDPRAREEAIRLHGVACAVCGFNFENVYGPLGKDYVHVHHLREISTLAEGYVVNPRKDLVPVCANCHSMLHRTRPALSIPQLRRRLRRI